jgi:hypothetical protein
MAPKNLKQINIWLSSHEYIKQVSEAYKAQGDSSMSMTALVSQACFSVPMPNGHQPPADPATNDDAGSVPS